MSSCCCCKIEITNELNKFYVFEKDRKIQKRLIYKINQLTGKDFEEGESIICTECRYILVQIHNLEQTFVEKCFDDIKEENNSENQDSFHNESIDGFDDVNQNYAFNLSFDNAKDDDSFDASFPDEEETEEGLKISIKVPDDNLNYKDLVCPHCQKKFDYKSKLETHIRTHTGGKPFKCHLCEATYSFTNKLKEHFKIHTGEKPFECGYCGKSFRNRQFMVKHTRIHTKDNPYKCTVCPKTFSQKSNLKTHLKVHSEERPFSCKDCSRSYYQKANLTKHVEVHHNEAKPFKCLLVRNHSKMITG